jgi:ubiquinone/menaquinone biosynthesis C-methylase UbiE
VEKREIREAYDRVAPWFDLLEAVPDVLLGSRRLRKEVLGRAGGRVLEVAVGTGRNLPHYPAGCRVTGVDLSPGMLARCRRRARRLGRDVPLALMDAEDLGFPAGSFDTVVDAMALCTFPDPMRALREMARVCRPGGRILLVEHGRSSLDALGRWQDRHEGWVGRRVGCHWNREPRELVEEAGLTVLTQRRRFLGVFHGIVATPGG